MDERTATRLAQYRQFGETVFRDAAEPLRSWLLVGAGLVLWQTAFVTFRVRATEVAYEQLLKALEIEFGEGAQRQPASDQFGAKTSVILSLLAAGVLAIALGLLKLI